MPFMSMDAIASVFPVTLGDALSHVLDKDVLLKGSTFAISMNTITLILGTFVFFWVMTTAAKAISLGPESEGHKRYMSSSRLGQVVEVIVIALRDMFIKPQLGDKTNQFLPFLMTLFFFIWIINLIGLIPLIDVQYIIGYMVNGSDGYDSLKFIGGTATGRLATNAAIAMIAFLVWNGFGIKENGIGGWLHHFLGGAPWYLAPIMVPVEIIGAIVKPTALAIRLFANMTAGHVLLAAIIGFSGLSFGALGVAAGFGITVLATVAAVLVFFLEVFVATLQAFVFMFLTTVFIAQMGHHDHGDHEDHEHEGSAIPEGAQLGAA